MRIVKKAHVQRFDGRKKQIDNIVCLLLFKFIKEGPYQDRPLLCPFRLPPLLTCS